MDEVISNLETIYREVFGYVGDEPDIYSDYDRCVELMGKMQDAIRFLHRKHYGYLP